MELSRDLILGEEQKMLVESLSAFRRDALDDIARDIDEEPDSGKVAEAFRRGAGVGLADALLSEGAGGQGMDVYSFCLALTEVSRGSAGFGALILSHNLALYALEMAGARQDYAGLAVGEERAAIAWPFTARSGGGSAPFVPGGVGAARLVFLAPGGEDIFSVSPDDEGVTVDEIADPMGFRCSRPATVAYSRVGAAAAGTLGLEAARQLEGMLLLGVASIAQGISRQAHEKAYTYARDRYQGGDQVINHQQIRLMLARMIAGIEAGDALVRQVAAGDCTFRLASCRVAKVVACDAAMSAALDGVQVHGGYGYMRDYGMERLMRDAKYCQAYPWAQSNELLAVLSDLE
jgi:alkylation response protein AidB-like acyl-CoA dehydrogenase